MTADAVELPNSEREPDVISGAEVADRAEVMSEDRSGTELVAATDTTDVRSGVELDSRAEVGAAAGSELELDARVEVVAAARSGVVLDVKVAESDTGADIGSKGEAEADGRVVGVEATWESVGILETGSCEEVGAAASTAESVDIGSGKVAVVDYFLISMDCHFYFLYRILQDRRHSPRLSIL